MADIRTMKLNLLADVSQFGRGMSQANADTNGLQKGMSKNSKKMIKSIGAVTVAVGAMAIAIGVDAVKAAAEDEASQAKFRETLKDTAGVIDKTVIKSIDEWIQKQQFASGYSDGELRDSLGRLTRSTGNVAEAQDLLNLSMDIARGTGKNLDDVALNLAKAYDGNEGALKRMGIPLDENIIKTGNFKDITDELTRLFGGQASTYADTYQGKLDIVNQRLGEFKEGAGKGLLDTLGKLLEMVNDVAKGFSGEDPDGLSTRARELAGEFNGNGAYTLGGSLKAVAEAFGDLFKELNSSDAEGGTSTLEKLAASLETFAGAINNVTAAYRKAGELGTAFRKSIVGQFVYAEGQFAPKSNKGGAAGGMVRAGQPITVGEYGKETFIPTSGGQIVPKGQLGGGGVVINLNGIVDAESARRSIEKLMQDSSRRTGAVNFVGATL